MARLSAPGAGLAIVALCAIPAYVTGFGSTELIQAAAPPPTARAILGILWLAIQVASLLSLHLTSARGFGLLCGMTTFIGMLVMAFGRGGLPGLWPALTFALPIASVCGASMIWLSHRRPEVTHAQPIWRYFIWLAGVGASYLFAALPQAAVAQLGAIAVALAVCGVAAMCWRAIVFSLASISRLPPTYLAVGAWVGAIAILFLNGLLARQGGLPTPQVVFGPLSLAPYFMAAGLALVGAAMDCEAARTNPRTAALRTVVGLVAAGFIYKTMMDESGTLAILLIGTLIVYLISAPPKLAAVAIGLIVAGQLVLQNPVAIRVVSAQAPRVGERLLAWTDRAEPPDQMLRVADAARLSGATGHLGAARMGFVVGPQVSKDFMPTHLIVTGGWGGAAAILIALILLVSHMYLAAKNSRAPTLRAIQSAAVALVLANLLITTLWMGGFVPFVGVPFPLLGRGGSHLLALALMLLLCDAASEADLSARKVKHHAA